MAEAVVIDIGKSLAVDAAKALVKLIMSRASGEAKLAWGFADQLDKLQRKFEYVEAFLEDLSRSNYQGQQSRLLDAGLKRFQNVAYLTDNLMDEYAYVIISRKLKLKYSGTGITKFRYKVVQTPLFFRFRMSLKVNHILSLFDELDVEAKTLGLNQVEILRDVLRGTSNGNYDMSLNQAREHVSDTGMFVGRKDDERDLLKKLCDSYNEDSSLPIIAIVGMGDLRRLPSSFEELVSLQKIWIYDCELENVLPANLSVFRELYYLSITSYSAVSLRSMLEAVEQLPNIQVIGVNGFKDEQQLEEYFSDMTPFLRLQSLKELMLMGYPEIRSLPEQLQLLTRITVLNIGVFTDLEEIPDWLCNLSSLETLKFTGCYSLRCLPSKEAMLRLTRLRCLEIRNCPPLKESYVKDRGPEWHKVGHLSYIEVDGEEIF